MSVTRPMSKSKRNRLPIGAFTRRLSISTQPSSMSATARPDRPAGRGPGSNGDLDPDRLVVVTVTESVAPTLTGREDCSYRSPPQPREQGMTLVRLLLGCAAEPANGDGRWVAPIAGGRRVVTLVEERSR
jgi:hypothetical protein